MFSKAILMKQWLEMVRKNLKAKTLKYFALKTGHIEEKVQVRSFHGSLKYRILQAS